MKGAFCARGEHEVIIDGWMYSDHTVLMQIIHIPLHRYLEMHITIILLLEYFKQLKIREKQL